MSGYAKELLWVVLMFLVVVPWGTSQKRQQAEQGAIKKIVSEGPIGSAFVHEGSVDDWDAVFVDPAAGKDDGATGSKADPFRTVYGAARGSNKELVVLRNGLHYVRTADLGRELTLRPFPGEDIDVRYLPPANPIHVHRTPIVSLPPTAPSPPPTGKNIQQLTTSPHVEAAVMATLKDELKPYVKEVKVPPLPVQTPSPTVVDRRQCSLREIKSGDFNECSLKEYSRSDLVSQWAGRRIVVSGKAEAADVFMQIVEVLQGNPMGKKFARYFTTNGTVDALEVSLPKRGEYPVANPKFELLFDEKALGLDYSYMPFAIRGNVDVQIEVLGQSKKLLEYVSSLKEFGRSHGKDFTYVGIVVGGDNHTEAAEAFESSPENVFTIPRPNHDSYVQTVLNSLLAKDRGLPKKCTSITYKQPSKVSCATKRAFLPKGTCSSTTLDLLKSHCDEPADSDSLRGCFMPGLTSFTDGRSVSYQCKGGSQDTGLPRCGFEAIVKGLNDVTKTSNGPWAVDDYGDQRIVLRNEKCSLVEHSQEDILTLFKGKSVLFTGDSHFRQLFTKLVMILRGRMWDYNFEYKTHGVMFYATNGTHDVLMTEIPKSSMKMKNQIMEMQYIWGRKVGFNEQAVTRRGIPDLHISSFGQNIASTDSTMFSSYITSVLSYATAHPTYNHLFLSPTDSLDHITNKLVLPNTRVLPVHKYAVLPFFEEHDHAHMCGTVELFPSVVGERTLEEAQKLSKEGHRCHDVYDANLWTVIFNAVDGLRW
eukprot:TRINITY_DN2207_c5_g1_i1.p1 TRINITY_DN2207_c5_g1~~TRINITY_DN2207_c5_g1_i1.p1  ORF type:complete len:760 (+),score=87.89 TRINITY_DN2207_c5_g1_i1:51-2330(+)